jgi:hypothetical protein
MMSTSASAAAIPVPDDWWMRLHKRIQHLRTSTGNPLGGVCDIAMVSFFVGFLPRGMIFTLINA